MLHAPWMLGFLLSCLTRTTLYSCPRPCEFRSQLICSCTSSTDMFFTQMGLERPLPEGRTEAACASYSIGNGKCVVKQTGFEQKLPAGRTRFVCRGVDLVLQQQRKCTYMLNWVILCWTNFGPCLLTPKQMFIFEQFW